MEHPAKRQRLETLPQFSDDDEIALFEGDGESLPPEIRDRIASRNRFKSALEDIFEKYGQDFTGVGDEIDLQTGEVVVDNGHLTRIKDVEECLGVSEEDADFEDDSDGVLLDRERRELHNQSKDLATMDREEWDEQPLASLHLDLTMNRRAGIAKHHKTRLVSQAKDPKWQVPDIPSIKLGSRYDYKNEMQAAIHGFGLSGPDGPKSPGRSLRKDARYFKNYQKTSPRSLRTQNIWHEPTNAQDRNVSVSPKAVRGRNIYNNDISYSQAQSFERDAHQVTRNKKHTAMTAEERAVQREAAFLLAKTGEWSVSEEQELIKYRLNTSLSYAALAVEFPGKTATMVKQRWKYLKKKMIELPATRMKTTLDETRTHQRHGLQRLSGAQYTTYSPGEIRTNHSEGSSRRQRDIPPRLQSMAGKSLSSEREPQVYKEAPHYDRGHQNNSHLISSKQAIVHTTETQPQQLHHNASSNTLLEAEQKEDLHHPLQTFDHTNDIIGQLFPPYEQQQTLDDTWNIFPPFDQLQNIGNEENRETLDHSRRGSVPDFYTTWQNHKIEAPIAPVLVPYGLISHNDLLLPDKNNLVALQEIPVAQAGAAVNSHQNFQETHDIAATEAGILRVELDGDDSRASSSTIDLMTLASDTRIQADWTPDSSHSLIQLPYSLHSAKTSDTQQHLTRQAATQLPGSTKDLEARVPLQITSIPDTQDPSSPMAIRSSGHTANHPYQALESALPDIEIPTNLSLEKAIESSQKPCSDPTKLIASMSRQSSPLSSLSSSDPRIARSSELLSSIAVKETETSKLHDTFLKPIETTFKAEPSVPLTEAIEQIDPLLLNSSIDIDRVVVEPKTPPSQGRISMQPAKTPAMIDELAKTNVKLPNYSTQATSYKQVALGKRKLMPPNVMKEADDTFQSIFDSLEESIVLLEPLTKRNHTSKYTVIKGAPSAHRVSTIRQHYDHVMHRKKVFKPGLQISEREHKMPKPGATREIQERAEGVFNANLQFTQSTAHRANDSSSFRERKVARSGQENSKNASNYMAFKGNNVVSSKENDLLRYAREMTPIDTYDYMLADPWPIDPLPTDRIPGIWKPPQLKDEDHVGEKTTETALQRHQDLELSSQSTSEALDVNSEAGEKSQNQRETKASSNTNLEKESKQILPTQSDMKTKSKSASITGRDSKIDEGTRAIANPTKPNSAITLPAKNSHRIPLPQSSGYSVSGGTMNTPKKQSPTHKAEDILLEFGKGRPLTRANLLSQDEIPSTSQETVLSFLNSQATQPSRPISTPKSSLLAQHSRARSVSAANICGINGFRCDRRLCPSCASRVVSQEEIDF